MPHIVKSEDFKKMAAEGKAKYVFAPAKKSNVPPPDPRLADAIEKVAQALAAGQAEQRSTILQSMRIQEQMYAAIGSMQKNEPSGPWRVTVTKRDPLGRIAEVEFKPT